MAEDRFGFPIPGDKDWDPFHQVFFLYGPDGVTEIQVPMDFANFYIDNKTAIAANYGAQIGACIMMLLVMIFMTQWKAVKAAFMVSIANLVVSIIRFVLLICGLISPLENFYVINTGDFSHVSNSWIALNVTANTLGLVQIALIEAALMIQAWTVVKMWHGMARYAVFSLSTAIALLAVGWKFASVFVRNENIITGNTDTLDLSIQLAEPGLIVLCISIFYFAALFGLRLAIHMWQNRSFLPGVQTLTAMDVLVMASGVLMIVPIIFAGLQWGSWANFVAASLTYTTVILVLPLGTLIAQHIAKPQFSYPSGSSPWSGERSVTLSSTRPLSQGMGKTKGSMPVHSQGSGSSIFSRFKKIVDPVEQELEKIDTETYRAIYVNSNTTKTNESV